MLQAVVHLSHVMKITWSNVSESSLGMVFRWQCPALSSSSRVQCPVSSVHRPVCIPMPAPQPRRYKHITWRNGKTQSGWIVQWRGRTWGGFHATQSQAAATLKDAMGLSALTHLPLLQKKAVAKPQTVRFKGVYWHKSIRAYTTRTATWGDIQDTTCCCEGHWCGEQELEAQHHPQQGQSL